MRIIEIASQDNGAHRNQNGGVSVVPEGWAVIPADANDLPNFPFGNFEVEERYGNGILYMKDGSWEPLPMPEPEPEPEPEPTTEQRVTDLEEAMELLLSGATGETEVAEDEA